MLRKEVLNLKDKLNERTTRGLQESFVLLGTTRRRKEEVMDEYKRIMQFLDYSERRCLLDISMNRLHQKEEKDNDWTPTVKYVCKGHNYSHQRQSPSTSHQKPMMTQAGDVDDDDYSQFK